MDKGAESSIEIKLGRDGKSCLFYLFISKSDADKYGYNTGVKLATYTGAVWYAPHRGNYSFGVRPCVKNGGLIYYSRRKIGRNLWNLPKLEGVFPVTFDCYGVAIDKKSIEAKE